MMNSQEFGNWCKSLNLSQSASEVIRQIRAEKPSRRVQGGRGNVSGFYPSRKMGVTISFESHRHELARIYELEHNPDVLEYYDQPPAIELCYQSLSGRNNRHLYTPDFFIISNNSAFWEECKSEQELVKFSAASPNRYQQDENGIWRCPPGENYAQKFGLEFRVWSSALICWIFQQNFIWLEDYLNLEPVAIDNQVTRKVLAIVETNPGILLADLIKIAYQKASLDDIYTLIATEQIYVNLNTARLSEPEQVKVFANREIALAYERITSVKPSSIPSNLQSVEIAVGKSLSWDGESWDVVNTGTTTTGLLRTDGKFVELPNATVFQLIQDGKITVAPIQSTAKQQQLEELLRHAKPQDIVEANHRYTQLSPYLSSHPPVGITRTIRRWRKAYQQASEIYGNGFVGLLPKNTNKGNYKPRLDPRVQEFMTTFISENYETLKQRGRLRVYESFRIACESQSPKINPPSFNRFCLEIQRRSGYEQTLKRQGRRAAIQKSDFYWQLELTTPIHGERPFEIVHIDHTQLDIELVSSPQILSNCHLDIGNTKYKNLGRPWATFMVDAYSRRLLAIYLTFDEPSYRSILMVIRICVMRFKRFPQTIVVDNGAEFHSHYFDQLLATYACTKKHRPPAYPRFGSVVERLFGTANTQLIYELLGNTQLTRKHRCVTKSVSPSKQAVWTLIDLYSALLLWGYEVYEQREHPALGQTPRDAFNVGIALGGSRLHRRVEYDNIFRILTLPAPQQSKRKIQPGQGVKIHNIYYWNNEFRNPEIEFTSVDVRYDPWDAGIAYALVQGQWVECISKYYQYFKGRSEKEIQLVSAELLARKRLQGHNFINSDRELVQFLNSVELTEEKLLLQRLKNAENKSVLQLIEDPSKVRYVSDQLHSDFENNSSEVNLLESENNYLETDQLTDIKDTKLVSLEYYGEF